MTPTVVCVLRSGGEYAQEHVIALRTRMQLWWPTSLPPMRFVCLTDLRISLKRENIEVRPLRHDWPTWWAKMEMFSAEHDDLGDIFYVDLDTIPVGPLDQLVAVNQLALLQDFYYPNKISAGLMYLPKYVRPTVMADWMDVKSEVMNTMPGDSDYLNALLHHGALRWQQVFPDQIVSYKVHVRQRKGQEVPAGARIVCYHGRPRPWDTPLWQRA